jgi:transposase
MEDKSMPSDLFSNKSDGKKLPRHQKVTFKPYEQQKDYLFPQSTADYLPADHIARLLSTIIDRLDLSQIEARYKGGGASAYHPRMLLKVWLLGFVYRIYSTRQLARAIREHVAFIWVAANSRPDFHTLNNFRLNLEKDIKAIFVEILQTALHLGMIDGKDIFIDHSKMEASANRHKIIWRKNIERNLKIISDELDKIFHHVKEVDAREDRIFSSKVDLSHAEFSNDDVDLMIHEINNRLKSKDISKENASGLKNSLRRSRELTKRKSSYEQKRAALGIRNSFSKTDPDATAMMQKDHVSVKPGYNVGIVTQSQVVLDYGVTNTVSENTNFKSLVEGTQANTGIKPENVIADSGYGNEENYTYLEEENIQALIKYNTFDKEKSQAWSKKRIRRNQFLYQAESDSYRCPAGQTLAFLREAQTKSATGFVSHIRIYQARPESCGICPLKTFCTDGRARSININTKLDSQKRFVKLKLQTKLGKQLYVQRSIEPETVFGDQFNNNRKRRFLLRGLNKVSIEAGLYYISHNIRKMHWYLLDKHTVFRIERQIAPG